jgi:hypothetical protein
MEYWEKDDEIGGFKMMGNSEPSPETSLHHSSTPLLQKDVESSRGIVSPLSAGQSKLRPLCLSSLLQRRRFDG